MNDPRRFSLTLFCGAILAAPQFSTFAQVESRLDLDLRQELAAGIPLVPVEGRLSADAAGAVAIEEGASRTFPVRDDVDLARHKVGDKVVFQITEMIAIDIEQP